MGPSVFFGLGIFIVIKGYNYDREHSEGSSKYLDESLCGEKELADHLPYGTCAEVISGSKSAIGTINLIGLVLVAYISCLAGGALDDAIPPYSSMSFTFIILYAVFLGYRRLMHEHSIRIVQKEMDEKRFGPNDFPQIVTMIVLARVNRRVVGYAVAVPAATIILGVISAWSGLPDKLAFCWLAGVLILMWIEFPVLTWVLKDKGFINTNG